MNNIRDLMPRFSLSSPSASFYYAALIFPLDFSRDLTSIQEIWAKVVIMIHRYATIIAISGVKADRNLIITFKKYESFLRLN